MNQTPQTILDRYKDDPIRYFTECLDVDPKHIWSKMVEIAESVRDFQFTCVKAGNSLSKSFTISRLALWFLYTHYPATVVTTAPSNTQVEEIIWREIASAHSNAKIPLGGVPLKTSLDLQTWVRKQGIRKVKKWNAIGFATKPDTAEEHATRFQGFHNENVLVIIDEGAGVHTKIYEAVDKLLTTKTQKLCVIGNPTMARGDFVNCFKDKRFNKITVSVFDSPNYKQDREVIPGLSGREFVQSVKDKYGEHSNYFKAMVTGEIPDEDIDSLIPINWIEKAELAEVDFNFKFIKKFVTWDVADGGDDLHVLKAWENTTEIDSEEYRGKKVEEVESSVWRFIKRTGSNAIIVDADGIGRVAVQLLELSCPSNITIIAFEGSSRDVYDPQTFYNRRHEAHWKMRDLFEKRRISISKHPEQREELAAIKLISHSKGFIAVEKKKDLKVRLGRSPDRADCIMMMAGAFDEVPILRKTNQRYRRDFVTIDDYPFTPETC